MKLNELKGKKICILGFGREGKAMLDALPECDAVVADKNSKFKIQNSKLSKANMEFGKNYLNNLERFDIIIKSPGVPPRKELEAVKTKITNSTQIFLDTIADTGAIVIGVTGSKGKSTTASLIYAILKTAGRDVYLAGNIGIPAISLIKKAKPGAVFVLEMSSAQLMNVKTSPQIAVITSFFPEHLDYHETLENYFKAKTNITRWQGKNDYVVFSKNHEGARKIANASPGRLIPCSEEDSPIKISETNLLGSHNAENIACACKAAEVLGIAIDTAIKAIKEFQGLPHRLQNLGLHHGITWIDDSISTTPESAIAALDALGNHVQTIILGGKDRGLDYSVLGKRIAESKVKNVILIGESSLRIRKAIEMNRANVALFDAKDMKTAVSLAKETSNEQPAFVRQRRTTAGRRATSNVCLLSPASASFDMFKNFEERGDEFKKFII